MTVIMPDTNTCQNTCQTKDILKKAGKDALGSGLPGMLAMSVQVASLMWLRTTVNYQYRYGTDMRTAMTHLYRQGGVKRFYQGLGPALIQAPLSRFGDTASNAGILSLMDAYEHTRGLPLGVKTMAASVAAAGFRICLMPVDTLKTSLQVDGSKAWQTLRLKYQKEGLSVFYRGSLAASMATLVGHYPWFLTYNTLTQAFPSEKSDPLHHRLLRSAAIGFCATAVSDTCANSVRVIKTTRQTMQQNTTYLQIIRMVIEQDGVLGLMGRGLVTKIVSNGLQGLMFSVAWRLAQDAYHS